MKVFISWSGARSRAVANLLSEWIRCVLQATRPWISTRDLDRGSLWFSEIAENLQDAGIGIICITRENRERPWLLFEAGAIMKGLSKARVCTFLVDLQAADIRDPLAQFNHTFPSAESMRALIDTLNRALSTSKLDDSILERTFATYWPQFESEFREILNDENLAPADPEKPRPESDILGEILLNTRQLRDRLSVLEGNQRESIAASPSSEKATPNRSVAYFLRPTIGNVRQFEDGCKNLGLSYELQNIESPSSVTAVVRFSENGIRPGQFARMLQDNGIELL